MAAQQGSGKGKTRLFLTQKAERAHCLSSSFEKRRTCNQGRTSGGAPYLCVGFSSFESSKSDTLLRHAHRVLLARPSQLFNALR